MAFNKFMLYWTSSTSKLCWYFSVILRIESRNFVQKVRWWFCLQPYVSVLCPDRAMPVCITNWVMTRQQPSSHSATSLSSSLMPVRHVPSFPGFLHFNRKIGRWSFVGPSICSSRGHDIILSKSLLVLCLPMRAEIKLAYYQTFFVFMVTRHLIGFAILDSTLTVLPSTVYVSQLGF